MFSLQFTPLVVPMLLAAGLSGFLAYFQWKRGPGSGAASFVALMIGAAIWTITSALELASPALQAKFIYTVANYVGITLTTAAWFTFTLEYTGQERLLTPRYIALLAIEPVLAVILAATNPLHHLFWTRFALSGEGTLEVVHGPAFWGHAVYSYLLMLAGAGLLIRAFIISPQFYRGQVVTMLLAAGAPWAANFLYLSRLSPIPNLDLTPFGFTFTGVFSSWSMMRYHLLDVIPIARHTVIQSMGDAMLVLDKRDRILDANPAALRLFACATTTKLVGQPVGQVLPPWTAIAEAGQLPDESDHEFKLDAECGRRDFRMHFSPVHNRRGEVKGQVLLLRDITSQRQAEEDLRGVLAAMRDTILVLDSEGRYLRTPQTSPDTPSRLSADLVGKTIHDVFEASKAEELLGYIREAIESGQTVRAEYSLPVGGVGERWINASISPMGDDRVVWVSRDMTERKRAEQALHESEERFRMLFHHSPDAIVLFDPSVEDPLWPIVDCNEAFQTMNGYERDELIGQSIETVNLASTSLEKHREFIRLLERDGLVERENVHRRKDGTIYPIHFMATLVTLNGKQLVMGVDRDITEQKHAEQALQESEERFRMLFHHSPDAIVLLDPSIDDPSWPIVDCNEAFLAMNDFERDELIGKSIDMVHVTEENPYKRQEFLRRLGIEGRVENEIVHSRRDGTTYPVHFLTALVKLGGKHLVLGIDRDISERKRAEQALHESEERFRMLFHHSPDAIVLLDPSVDDPSWPIIDCNEAFLAMNGFERDELIGQSIDVVHMNPDSTAGRQAFLEQLQREGRVENEIIHERRDGTTYPVHFLSSLVNLNGKQLVLGIDRDITERKQAEQALHESEERFRMLFHHSPDAIVLFDPSVEDPLWPIVDCNEAFLTMNGYERDELIGQSIETVHVTQGGLERRREFLKRLERGGRVESEVIHSRRDGMAYPVHLLATLVNLNEKELVLGIERDISERKQAEAEIRRYRDHLEEMVAERTAELNEANQTISASLHEKEVLLKEIHHRVKNNLQVISSLLNLQSGYVEDETAIALFTESRNRVHSMALIHEQLYRSTDFTRVDFASYAQELTRRLLVSYRARANGIDLRLSFDEIYLDVTTAIPCGLIINELVSNAIKHGFPGGERGVIEVEMAVDKRDEEEGYRLTVHNDGMAFPEGLDFRNTDTLGLQLVNSLTRQLDGEIDLRLEAGTTFEIRFPRTE